MADDRNRNESATEMANAASSRGGLRPGCLMVILPLVCIVVLIGFGLLGAISVWVVVPIAAALAGVAGFVWYLNRLKK